MATARARPVTDADDPVSHFFASITAPGRIATFEHESAALRFDVQDGGYVERWHVAVNNGDVSVKRQNGHADAIVRIQRPVFEAVVTGRTNAQAALLRGLIDCEGSVAALMMFQRCLPGPPGSTGKVAPISSKTVTAQRRAM
jgi:putative sterol carrier protein